MNLNINSGFLTLQFILAVRKFNNLKKFHEEQKHQLFNNDLVEGTNFEIQMTQFQ